MDKMIFVGNRYAAPHAEFDTVEVARLSDTGKGSVTGIRIRIGEESAVITDFDELDKLITWLTNQKSEGQLRQPRVEPKSKYIV